MRQGRESYVSTTTWTLFLQAALRVEAEMLRIDGCKNYNITTATRIRYFQNHRHQQQVVPVCFFIGILEFGLDVDAFLP
jgi:hypothetical protein